MSAAVALAATATVGVWRWSGAHDRHSCLVSELVPKALLVNQAMHQRYGTVLLGGRPGSPSCRLTGPLAVQLVGQDGHHIEEQSVTLDSSSGKESTLTIDAKHWAEINLTLPVSFDIEGDPISCASELSVASLSIRGSADVQSLSVPVPAGDRPLDVCGGFSSEGTFQITSTTGRQIIETTPRT